MFIRTTKTQTGLRVRASLIKGDYATGISVPLEVMATVNAIPHEFLPAWNFAIVPDVPLNVKSFLRGP